MAVRGGSGSTRQDPSCVPGMKSSLARALFSSRPAANPLGHIAASLGGKATGPSAEDAELTFEELRIRRAARQQVRAQAMGPTSTTSMRSPPLWGVLTSGRYDPCAAGAHALVRRRAVDSLLTSTINGAVERRADARTTGASALGLAGPGTSSGYEGLIRRRSISRERDHAEPHACCS